MATVFLLTRNKHWLDETILHLSGNGFVTKIVDGYDALESIAREGIPDVLLLDTFSLSHEELTQASTYSKAKSLPILSVLDESILKENHIDVSVGDFVSFPFSNAEIAIRIGRLVHNLQSPQSEDVIFSGGLVIDQRKYEVLLDGDKIFLTYKEYELLRLLASSPGQVFTREDLLSKVWGYDYFGGTRTVDVHIRRLRGKVEHPARTFIETVWNVGYRFKENITI